MKALKLIVLIFVNQSIYSQNLFGKVNKPDYSVFTPYSQDIESRNLYSPKTLVGRAQEIVSKKCPDSVSCYLIAIKTSDNKIIYDLKMAVPFKLSLPSFEPEVVKAKKELEGVIILNNPYLVALDWVNRYYYEKYFKGLSLVKQRDYNERVKLKSKLKNYNDIKKAYIDLKSWWEKNKNDGSSKIIPTTITNTNLAIQTINKFSKINKKADIDLTNLINSIKEKEPKTLFNNRNIQISLLLLFISIAVFFRRWIKSNRKASSKPIDDDPILLDAEADEEDKRRKNH